MSYSKRNKSKSQVNMDNYNSNQGICYTDRDGGSYTRKDIDLLTRNPEVSDYLIKSIDDLAPEEYLDNGFIFKKCNRCGTYLLIEDLMSKRRDFSPVCPNCRPVKIKGVFPVVSDPYYDGRKFYKKRKITFEPGISTIFGCNGSGKTTLFTELKKYLKHKGIPYFLFDNTGEEGGQRSPYTNLGRFLAGFSKGDNDLMLGIWGLSASEGENVLSSFSTFLSYVLHESDLIKEYGEVYILIDALDSGLSYDIITMIKKTLEKIIYDKLSKHVDVYIIISSNSWEMSEGTKCFSVEKMKYVSVKSYQKFCSLILSSSVAKKNRDQIFEDKKEIASREKNIYRNEEIEKAVRSYKHINKSCLCSVELDDYKLSLNINDDEFIYTLCKNGDQVKINKKETEDLYEAFDGWRLDRDWDKIFTDVIVDRIYKDEKLSQSR